ncbi:MAG: hypothetical protein KDD90_08630 [Sphingomonadaceae bacterium]|nr:hypothetical protein [Sphingomonadaceae bacterium]
MDELDRILAVSRKVGLNWTGVTDIGKKRTKQIMRDVPAYDVEIALASAIENLQRPITPNDIRDMQSYVSAIPYSDVLVGEKLFINLAVQAGLGKRYGSHLHTSIYSLEQYL